MSGTKRKRGRGKKLDSEATPASVQRRLRRGAALLAAYADKTVHPLDFVPVVNELLMKLTPCQRSELRELTVCQQERFSSVCGMLSVRCSQNG